MTANWFLVIAQADGLSAAISASRVDNQAALQQDESYLKGFKMLQRVNILKNHKCEDIDSMPTSLLPIRDSISENIIATKHEILSCLPVNYGIEVENFLRDYEHHNDSDLVRLLTDNFIIDSFPSENYIADPLLVSKVNHGFWEHFAFLHASPEHRSTYRDVNLPLRQTQYLTENFLDVLLGGMLSSLSIPSIKRFISCTTGVQTFTDCLGAPWTSPAGHFETYKLSDFKRGAVRGLLAFAHLCKIAAPSQAPLRFYDSYSNNKSFEDGILLRTICQSASKDDICLVMGPERLSGVRITDWPGRHSFLCLSSYQAQSHWQFNLVNLLSVLQHYADQGRRVVILFQGAVLGPVMARFLSAFLPEFRNKVSFIDLGRLLDIAYEADITRTGSPLPSRAFDSKNMLNIVKCEKKIFQEA